MGEASSRGESVPRYEAVCDCCLETQELWTPELITDDCPVCGVGKLLGPWPARPRFESNAEWQVSFRRDAEEAKRRELSPEPDFYLE